MKNIADDEKARVLVCSLDVKSPKRAHEERTILSPQESAQELVQLAETLDMEVCDVVIQHRPAPDPAT